MFMKHIRASLPALALAVLLVGLSACGRQSASSLADPSHTPDQLQIVIHQPGSEVGDPTVTLTNISLVQRFYGTFTSLALMPQNVACTADAGPSYTLTFLQGGKKLTTVIAQHFGCGDVSTVDKKLDKQANQTFWSQLNQAIYQATPIAKPTQLALLHTFQIDQIPQTARILSATTVQRLYQAVLTLPQTSQNSSCIPDTLPAYQLVFQTADQAIDSVIDQKCNTISLVGNHTSRSGAFTRTGTFIMNDQFKQLFKQTLKAASFAQARPDQLTLNLQAGNSVARQSTITDQELRQQLYTKIFALPEGKVQPDCPSNEDKVAGKEKWYTFNFTQWNLPLLMSVDVYEGSCRQVSLDANQGMATGQVLQGDGAFWNLVHQAAHS